MSIPTICFHKEIHVRKNIYPHFSTGACNNIILKVKIGIKILMGYINSFVKIIEFI